MTSTKTEYFVQYQDSGIDSWETLGGAFMTKAGAVGTCAEMIECGKGKTKRKYRVIQVVIHTETTVL